MYDKIVELTKKMVEIPSVNATLGEKNIGNFIYEFTILELAGRNVWIWQ